MRGVTGSTSAHGTIACSKWCKCQPCRKVRSAYEKRRSVLGYSRVDSTGTVRRLQALAAIGWSTTDLGARLGISAEAVGQRRRETWPAERQMVARTRALYDELSMTPGPSPIARRRALARGWAPPLAWDDDTIDDPDAAPISATDDPDLIDEAVIDRVLSGRPHRANRAERDVIVPELARRGLTDRQIADLVLTVPETILRTRRRLGVASGYGEITWKAS